jgi:protein TonB
MLREEPSQPRLLTLSDLDIETYVAPNFPRRALRRGLTGSVELTFSVFTDGSTGDLEIVNAEPGELFVRSAEDAVRQWRFTPPEDVVRARVKLRFEQDAR